jgi:hypothetical protein
MEGNEESLSARLGGATRLRLLEELPQKGGDLKRLRERGYAGHERAGHPTIHRGVYVPWQVGQLFHTVGVCVE